MKRFLVVAALTCSSLMAFPAPGSASLMDWLQELSGPGPFNAKVFNVIAEVCPTGHKYRTEGTSQKLDIFASEYEKRDATDSRKVQICVFFDNRRFKNDGAGDNFGAGTIDVHAFEIGASARLHRSLSIGFGVGRIGFGTENGSEPARFLITAPRLVFKPALIFGSEQFWERQSTAVKVAASVFKFYIKNNIISGKLTGADFGLSPGDASYNFAVSHDRVWSSGFVLDFSEVLALF